jgi:nucleoside-diphosphate-sugar epimerase
MRVLVIGGTRFMGRRLVWRLLARGERVTLLNRGLTPDPFGPRVERLRADRNRPSFTGPVAGRDFDAVVDFGAYTGSDLAPVVEALAGRVGHYVLISTGQVYLVRKGARLPSREEDYAGELLREPAEPDDRSEWQYGMGKRECEDLLQAAWEARRFPFTTLRLPMVDGEGDHRRRLEAYLWRLLDGGPVIVPDGEGPTVRHVYSGAVAEAVARLLGQSASQGRAYNLCQNEMPSLEAFLGELSDRLGAPRRLVSVPSEVLSGAGLAPHVVSPFSVRWMSLLDPSRARVELGFRHDSLKSVLDRIVAAFLAHTPDSPPESYARRGEEIALAQRYSAA